MSMSSAGRAENSNGCVTRPKGREIGLGGYAAQIQLCSLTGSYVMATAEHREPYESRGSRTVLGARGGEIPPRDSSKRESVAFVLMSASSGCGPSLNHLGGAGGRPFSLSRLHPLRPTPASCAPPASPSRA